MWFKNLVGIDSMDLNATEDMFVVVKSSELMFVAIAHISQPALALPVQMSLSRLVASLSQPCIPVNAKNVRILHSPVQFYNTLLVRRHEVVLSRVLTGPAGYDSSRQTPHISLVALHWHLRIPTSMLCVTISTLAISHMQQLQNLHDSLASNPRLSLHLNLDLLRSTRPGPQSTASLLAPLVASFPDRVHVHLFRSPKLHGVLAKLVPRRFDEGWGTWHAKVYGVDDEVLISG